MKHVATGKDHHLLVLLVLARADAAGLVRFPMHIAIIPPPSPHLQLLPF
jgi:hypothetical protein